MTGRNDDTDVGRPRLYDTVRGVHLPGGQLSGHSRPPSRSSLLYCLLLFGLLLHLLHLFAYWRYGYTRREDGLDTMDI